MTFSNVADLCFTWTINDFEKSSIDYLKKKSLSSPLFTTLIEPNRQWHLDLFITEKFGEHCERCKTRVKNAKTTIESCNLKVDRRIINLELVCDKIIENPADIKVNISILENLEKLYTRNFLVSGEETMFSFDNFIDFDELMKIINNDQLEILVEMFLRDEVKIADLKMFTNSKFLSDIQILIQGQKFYAHKVNLVLNFI